jgi:hypothetical protein
MADGSAHYSASVDARKCALEALATLANIKRIAADRILRLL